MTSERDTTINRLLTVVTFHSICDYDWALSSKIQRLRYTNPFKKFHPTDLWLNRLSEYFFRGSYPQKPCAIGKDLTVFIKEIGVSRYIGNPARFNILLPSYLSSAEIAARLYLGFS